MSPLAGAGAALGPEHGSHGYQHSYAQPETVATPIYRPEATCSGPIQYGTEMDLGTGLSDEEQMLAAMQALRQVSDIVFTPSSIRQPFFLSSPPSGRI
jgi:hypothetical protein